MSGYPPTGAPEAFARSTELFFSMVSELGSPDGQSWTHADLEDRLGERARELMRQLFQDRLDLTATREQSRIDVVGADLVARTRIERGHQRVLTTVFGSVTVTRKAYRAPNTTNLYPTDAVLNLPDGRHSDGLAKLAVIESVRGSFDGAGAAIARATGVTVGKPQLLSMVGRAPVDVDSFYADRLPDPSPDIDVLVMTNDGKGIRMRPEALREATRKAAATSSNKLTTRLSPGEKSGRKRMAELGAVYDITPAPRVAADIISTPATTKNQGPQARGKWLTASITDDIPTVIEATFDEATRRDPDHKRTWIALVDGNKQQIDAITAEAARREVTVTVLIDFVHVLEYIWAAAWSFFNKGDPEAETWVGEQATKILTGRARDVAAGIRRRATRYGYNPTERKGADDAATYLTNKRPHLDYATALTSGWPIATGIIEGAARHLVKDRFDVTGAKWGLDGAQAILALRAMIINGDFDDYWTYHLAKKHHRRHQTHYALAA